ncbi:formyltransferase family protein [Halorussus amylolyticus]|uniref:formyltransferase family protein n=1 Tax=Halorussus amylolyticus TaxID=1126242 RepID=UPI0010536FDC|nr:formyltransferase family protein [Halorussus amylolyticus]
MTATQLQVGLLVRGFDVPAWQARAVERMVARTGARVTHIVVQEGGTGVGERDASDYVRRVQENPLWSSVGAALRLGGLPEYFRPRQLGSIAGLDDPEVVRCEPEPASDFGNVLPAEGVEALEATDVGVRFAFGILKGEALDAPEHGVLSFHHGDLREYRGQPCGFWEFLNDEDTAGVTLQRLSETLDGGEIVAYEPVDIADARTWPDVRKRLFEASDDLLGKGVENVASGFEPRSPDGLGDLYSIPEGEDVLKYVLKEGKGRARKVVE